MALAGIFLKKVQAHLAQAHLAFVKGRPRKTTEQQDKMMVKWLLHNRDKEKVSVSVLKREFRFLRKLSDTLVEDRLFEANLSWLRRRKKPMVTKEYLAERVTYSQGIKRKSDAVLQRWAYTDGTVYYLDRSEAEAENSKRRALGTHVWRRSDNKDALNQDCIGPSSYSKGQGVPCKVWGMLACGVLHIHVLDEGESMDETLYTELIDDKFEEWRGNCDYLVCDYERCLRTDAAVHALKKANLTLVDPYPKNSQDFNAIENAWDLLQSRLHETQPAGLELREEFVKRLFRAVTWVNKYRAGRLWHLSTNQKERANACLAAKPPGGRTKF